MIDEFRRSRIRIPYGASKNPAAVKASKASGREAEPIAGIQYLRGLAALMVVFVHIGGMAGKEKYFGLNLFNGLYRGGGAGVQLFFVISGFIMVYVSLSKGTLAKKLTAVKFLRKRFVRIVPFMWLCIVGHAVLMAAGRETSAFPFLPYLRSFFLFPVGELLPNVIWTLRHEALFYFVFCLSFLLSKRLWPIVVLWVLSPLLWQPLAKYHLPNQSAWVEWGNFLFNSHNLLFGVGLAVGLLVLKGRWPYRWQAAHGFAVCLTLCGVLLTSANLLAPHADANKVVSNAVLGLICGLLIIGAISLTSKKSLSRLDKIGLLLGDASYSIYLTHSAILSGIFGVWAKFQKVPNPVLLVTVATVCCCVGGLFVHRLVEKPLIKFLQKKFPQVP